MKRSHASQRLLLLSGTLVSLFVVLIGMSIVTEIHLADIMKSPNPTCDDGGNNFDPFTKGKTTFSGPYGSGTFTDKCYSTREEREKRLQAMHAVKYGCSSKHTPTYKIADCSLGCSDGACRKQNQSSCGGENEPCCAGTKDQCTPGTNLTCQSNPSATKLCLPCGILGNACCGNPPSFCQKTPNPISCIDGVCKAGGGNTGGGDRCTTNDSCDDQNPCTSDTCNDGTCRHILIPGSRCGGSTGGNTGGSTGGNSCVSARDCNDGKVCTFDRCIDGFCKNTAIPNCGRIE